MTAEPSLPTCDRGSHAIATMLVVLAMLTGCAAEEPPPPPAPVLVAPVDPRVLKAPRNELQSGSWTIATDPETGINTALAGLPGAVSQPASGGGTLHVYVVALADGGSQLLSVGDLLGGADADPLIATINMARGANGRLTRNVPITVRGRYGADFRMTLVRGGKPWVMLGRMVFSPTKVIEITTVVPPTDEAAATPLHDYAADTIRIP